MILIKLHENPCKFYYFFFLQTFVSATYADILPGDPRYGKKINNHDGYDYERPSKNFEYNSESKNIEINDNVELLPSKDYGIPFKNNQVINYLIIKIYFLFFKKLSNQ